MRVHYYKIITTSCNSHTHTHIRTPLLVGMGGPCIWPLGMEGRASLADLEGGVVCGGLFPEPGDCRRLGAVVVVVTGISLRNLEVSNYNIYIT